MAGLRAFSAAILRRTSSSLGPWLSGTVASLGTIGAGFAPVRETLRAAFRLRRDRFRAKSLTVLFGNLKLQFGCEDVGDIPIRQPAATQLVYQFAVLFQTGATRFLGHLVQNVLKFVFHIPPKLHQHAPDRGRTRSGQKPDKAGTDRPLSGPPEPKPRGLGMVSIFK